MWRNSSQSLVAEGSRLYRRSQKPC
ncbi:protein of unknown function [Burkholderia multivorans]